MCVCPVFKIFSWMDSFHILYNESCIHNKIFVILCNYSNTGLFFTTLLWEHISGMGGVIPPPHFFLAKIDIIITLSRGVRLACPLFCCKDRHNIGINNWGRKFFAGLISSSPHILKFAFPTLCCTMKIHFHDFLYDYPCKHDSI